MNDPCPLCSRTPRQDRQIKQFALNKIIEYYEMAKIRVEAGNHFAIQTMNDLKKEYKIALAAYKAACLVENNSSSDSKM